MRIQENHLHAISVYKPITLAHFWWLLFSIVFAWKNKNLSITHHLPFEIEHPSQFSWLGRKSAFVFILYGELLKHLFGVRLYWENSPVLNVGKWDLKYGQTEWRQVPNFIDLTIDTGHVMLGARNKMEARSRIVTLFKQRGAQIKHIHVHENDFKTDLHLKPYERVKKRRVLSVPILRTITANRSYIFEDSA